MNIPTEFGSNWPINFAKENVKSLDYSDNAAAAGWKIGVNPSLDPVGQVR
jgi:hypothetical protein